MGVAGNRARPEQQVWDSWEAPQDETPRPSRRQDWQL